MEKFLTAIANKLESDYMDKYVDEDFLRWIFEETVKLDGTEEFVCNGFEWGGKAPFALVLGGYNKKEKKVQFFDGALKLVKSEIPTDMKINSEFNQYIATNLLFVNILFHELEHVNQEKKKREDDTFESYLLLSQEENQETNDSYLYIPSERFASNIAYRKTQSVLNNMGIIVPEIDDYFEKTKYYDIVQSYTDEANQCMIYPIKRYMDQHGIECADMSLSESVETYPNLDDRLFYGLPISDAEYGTIREKAGLANTRTKYSLW